MSKKERRKKDLLTTFDAETTTALHGGKAIFMM